MQVMLTHPVETSVVFLLTLHGTTPANDGM